MNISMAIEAAAKRVNSPTATRMVPTASLKITMKAMSGAGSRPRRAMLPVAKAAMVVPVTLEKPRVNSVNAAVMRTIGQAKSRAQA